MKLTASIRDRSLLKWAKRHARFALTLSVALPAVLTAPIAVQTAQAKPKGQTAAQLLHLIATHPPGKERDEAVDALIELGDSAWPEVRKSLDAIAAQRGGEDAVVDLLLGWGQLSYDEAVARAPKLGDVAARRLVRQILRYKEDERRTKILMAMLPRHDEELLLMVLPELLTTDPPPVLARLLQLVDDPRQNLRAYAIDTLVAQKHTEALQTIVRLLGIEQLKPSADNLNVRLKLIAAAARLGGETDAAVDPLLAALLVPDQREAALDGLLHVGAPAVKQAIFLLRTADRGRMETALAVLNHLKVQAAPQLLPLVASQEPRTRNLAADVLAQLAVPEVREDLIKMVRSKKVPDLRQAVMLCMTLYDESVRKLLLDLLKDNDVVVRKLAVEQLWRAADPETFAALRSTATRDADMHVRMDATQAMVGVGDPKAIELLRKMAIVNNQEERLAVLTTLGRVDDESGIPSLYQQLGDPSDEVFRVANNSIRRLTLHSGPRREGEWQDWRASERDRAKESFEEKTGTLRRFEVDGRELRYLERQDGTKNTIVVVSGPPFRDATHLVPHVWRLEENNRIAVLQRSPNERSVLALSEADRSRELAGLIDALRVQKVVLLADAAGAHLAMAYAAKHPEQVSHVVLHGGPFPSSEALKRLPTEVLLAMPSLWREDFVWALKQNSLLEATLRRRVLTRSMLTGLLAETELARRVNADNVFEDGFEGETLERAIADAAAAEIKDVQVPTLLLLGERAPWAASTLKDWAAMSGAQKKIVVLAKLKNAAGMPLVDAPEEAVNAILGFLQK